MRTITTEIFNLRNKIGNILNDCELPPSVIMLVLKEFLLIAESQANEQNHKDRSIPEQEEADIDGSTTP